MRFSANLGFLFTELPLPDAIRAAADAGFDAVECHFPFDTPPDHVAAALQQTGLAMLGLNTWPGDRTAGDFGLCALPDRIAEGRAAIVQAIDYARATGTAAVHVMAGKTSDPNAEGTFADNLAYACDLAAAHGITILIEPLNPRDVPGYFLLKASHTVEIIERLARHNLKMMFDCYHLQITGGDLLMRFRALAPHIGHVQFAGVPARAEPDQGEVDFSWLLPELQRSGWSTPFGAEYRPAAGTHAGLGWLARWKSLTPALRSDPE